MNPIRTCVFTLLLVTGCAGPGLLASEPMGKQLERALEEIKKDCIARGAPPFGPDRGGTKDSSCLMFTLKPWEPGDTPESAFAHSIKLPPPHDKPKDVYRPGMSSEGYFNALCDEEAGEWVFRRVEGVKGIVQERPTTSMLRGANGLVFYVTEPAAFNSENTQEEFLDTRTGGYRFFEKRAESRGDIALPANYLRLESGKSLKSTDALRVSKPSASFGFTWRGLKHPSLKNHAIDGYELIVFQKDPFEVLALRRHFNFYFIDRSTSDARAPWQKLCPSGHHFNARLIQSVLVPAKP